MYKIPKQDQDKIKNFFKNQLLSYGFDDTRSVAWNSVESQFTRYKIIGEGADFKNKKILDVGSGRGDLFGFLKDKNINYTGIEITKELADLSRKKYEGIKVYEGDFLEWQSKESFDFVVCSGSLNLKIEDYQNYLEENIKKMYSLSLILLLYLIYLAVCVCWQNFRVNFREEKRCNILILVKYLDFVNR